MRKLLLLVCIVALALLAATNAWATVQDPAMQAITATSDSPQLVAARGSPIASHQSTTPDSVEVNSASATTSATADNDLWLRLQVIKATIVATPTQQAVRGSPTTTVEPTPITTPIAQSADIWRACQTVAHGDPNVETQQQTA